MERGAVVVRFRQKRLDGLLMDTFCLGHSSIFFLPYLVIAEEFNEFRMCGCRRYRDLGLHKMGGLNSYAVTRYVQKKGFGQYLAASTFFLRFHLVYGPFEPWKKATSAMWG